MRLSRFFLGFSRFVRDSSEIFPICPFPLSRPINGAYKEQSRKVRDSIWTFPEKSGKPPVLETPRLSFSQNSGKKNSTNINFLVLISCKHPSPLLSGWPGAKKFLPTTAATGIRTFWCGRPRFSARTSMTRTVVESGTPRCGSGPKCRLEPPPLHPPCALGPLPPHQPGPPPSGALQKEPRGVGGRGKERAGREGVWLEGRVLQLQWGMGGGPSKHQLGPDPHLGAHNF